MRYIGHKRKLLPFIGDTLDQLGITPGRALDAFSGTATVARFLKSRGFTVTTCDMMYFSVVFQRAYVVADAYPTFSGLADDAGLRRARRYSRFAGRVEARAEAGGVPETAPLRRATDEVCVYLEHYLEPRTSFITTHYAAPADAKPTSDHRRYFTTDHAQRIDAIRHKLYDWRIAGSIADLEHDILLAALLEGADAVANTAGVYAAWIKSWQKNTRRPFRLPVGPIVDGAGQASVAHHGNTNTLVPRLGHFDLLYLDPPYNNRQYSAYYHIPEIIARGWFDEAPVIRGKTGLMPDKDLKSDWSIPSRCADALTRLIEDVDADHVLLSYNSEGMIPDETIERILTDAGEPGTFARVTRPYQRYRADQPSKHRRYTADAVVEQLYYIRLRPHPRNATSFPAFAELTAGAAR